MNAEAWQDEDPRMLREQIRVADLAFNHLHGEAMGLRDENQGLRAALKELAFAANNATPLVETVAHMEAANRLERAINAAEKLL